MINVYVYVLNTLADWEIGHIISELNSKRFFKSEAEDVVVKTVSISQDTVKTMGGMTIVPDIVIDDIVVSKTSMLILPGADTWENPENSAILEKAVEFLNIGAAVCAICGATVALARLGLLDNRKHTSNGEGFLDMFVPNYKGKSFYIDSPSVADNNLITAGSTGGLLWAKQIIEYLDVFESDTLKYWYKYFSTGNAEHFFALMQSLSKDNMV